MARPRGTEPSVHVHVYIPSSIMAQVRILLADPLTGKPPYGAVGKVVTELLTGWVDKQKKEHLTTKQ